MNRKVGIERCSSYDPEEVYKALKKAVERAGDLDVTGKTVLLKPNILSDTPPEKAIEITKGAKNRIPPPDLTSLELSDRSSPPEQ